MGEGMESEQRWDPACPHHVEGRIDRKQSVGCHAHSISQGVLVSAGLLQ